MNRIFTTLTGGLLLLLSAPAGFCQTAVAPLEPPTDAKEAAVALTLQGTGNFEVPADRFWITLRLKQEGNGREGALAAFQKQVARIEDAIRPVGGALATRQEPPAVGRPLGEGIAPEEPGVTLGSNERLRAVGLVLVDAKRLEMITPTLRALADLKLPLTAEVSCSASEPKRWENEALKRAVEDASTRAKILEQAAKPRRFVLLGMEEGAYIYTSPTKEVIPVTTTAREPNLRTIALQVTVTLRYTLADPPPLAAVKPPTRPPAKKPAGKKG